MDCGKTLLMLRTNVLFCQWKRFYIILMEKDPWICLIAVPSSWRADMLHHFPFYPFRTYEYSCLVTTCELNFLFLFKGNIDVTRYPLWCYSCSIRLKSTGDISKALNQASSQGHSCSFELLCNRIIWNEDSIVSKERTNGWASHFVQLIYFLLLWEILPANIYHIIFSTFIFFIESKNILIEKDLRKMFMSWLTNLSLRGDWQKSRGSGTFSLGICNLTSEI